VTTCARNGCQNHGKLVIDANVVHYMVGGAVSMAEKKYGQLTWDQRLPHVKEELTNNLNLITKCNLDGQMYMPDQIWTAELVRASPFLYQPEC